MRTPTPRRRFGSQSHGIEELAGVLKHHHDDVQRVAEEYAAKWPDEKRKAAVKSGDALPGGKFPIRDQEDLNNANALKGNSSVAQATVIGHMRKQAKKHGLNLPKSLQSNSTS